MSKGCPYHSGDPDPFRDARREEGVFLGKFDGETVPVLLRHQAVREAARDWQRFSSDAPFRVPIPSEERVRNVRQLPIETDPPLHAEYRKIIEPFFNRPREPWMQDRVREILDELLAEAVAAESIEAVTGFAIPLQCRALAVLLGVPGEEATEWMGWGLNALKDEGLSSEKGARLDNYIRRKLAEAGAAPGDDLFGVLQRATFQGRQLTDEEMVGFVNLVFAGGRDTIIHTATGILVWLSENPAALGELRAKPELVFPATEELIRYLSPLTHLARVCPRGDKVGGVNVAPMGRVSLCWSSANRDETVFDRPDEVVLNRKPNPHVAFGSGPHTCIGALHARGIFRLMLTGLSRTVDRVEILELVEAIEDISGFRRRVGYERLVVRLHPLAVRLG